jgi:hypothetical protein
MRYYSTTLATNLRPADWRMKLVYTLLWFIPRSNPDFEVHFSRVRRWYVEVDDSGLPSRELGIDERGTPITAGPWERNFGFWTDSGEPLPAERTEEIAKDVFEAMWERFADSEAQQSEASHVA